MPRFCTSVYAFACPGLSCMYECVCLGPAAPNSRHHVLENLFSGPWVSLLVCIYIPVWKKEVAVCFSEKTRLFWKHVFPDVFPDACLGFRFAVLPPAGQRSRKKHVLWPRLGYLASGGSKISKKARPGKKHAYIAYIGYIYIYIYIYMLYI